MINLDVHGQVQHLGKPRRHLNNTSIVSLNLIVCEKVKKLTFIVTTQLTVCDKKYSLFLLATRPQQCGFAPFKNKDKKWKMMWHFSYRHTLAVIYDGDHMSCELSSLLKKNAHFACGNVYSTSCCSQQVESRFTVVAPEKHNNTPANGFDSCVLSFL